METDLLRKIQVVEAVNKRPIQSASLPKRNMISLEIPEDNNSSVSNQYSPIDNIGGN